MSWCVLGNYNDIVKIKEAKLPFIAGVNNVHDALGRCGGIFQTKPHATKLLYAVVQSESDIFSIVLIHFYSQIAATIVLCREKLCVSQAVNEIIYPW